MTRTELMRAIARRLDVALQVRTTRRDGCTLAAMTRDGGVALFMVEIECDDAGWRFVGYSELLSDHWAALFALGRPADDRPATCGRCDGTGADLPPAPGALCTACDGTGEL